MLWARMINWDASEEIVIFACANVLPTNYMHWSEEYLFIEFCRGVGDLGEEYTPIHIDLTTNERLNAYRIQCPCENS